MARTATTGLSRPVLSPADQRTLTRRGVTIVEVRSGLTRILDRSNRRVRRVFTVGSAPTWDRFECPHCQTQIPSEVTTIGVRATGAEIKCSALALHSIREHGYFGPTSTEDRPTPAKLMDIVFWRGPNSPRVAS